MSTKLNIWMFYHRNEPSEHKPELERVLTSHWLDEMAEIGDCDVQILSREQAITGITDFDYFSAPPEIALRAFERNVQALIDEKGLHAEGLNKYVLLTGNPLMATPTGGFSRKAGQAAIASPQTGNYCLAREVGHLLGASFDAEQVEYVNGQVMDAYMHATTEYRRGKLYRYSDVNREQIRTYLKQH